MAEPLRRARICKGPFRFEAAHRLLLVPPGHQCGRPHGHSYEFWVELEGEVRACGWVADFATISAFGKGVEARFDHRDLNALVSFETTAENLAGHILTLAEAYFDGLATAVRVSETRSTWAEARLR